MARKVEVAPYDPAWPAQFQAEADRLRPLFSDNLVAIHHMGSTAVPGLSAKPILDLLVEVRDLARVDALNEALGALGYTPRGEYGLPGRRYFPRILPGATDRHTHHVHVYQTGNPENARHLAVRDYLRAHPDEAAAYAQIKQALADQHPWDIDAYVDGKDAYVKALEARAMAWAAGQPAPPR